MKTHPMYRRLTLCVKFDLVNDEVYLVKGNEVIATISCSLKNSIRLLWVGSGDAQCLHLRNAIYSACSPDSLGFKMKVVTSLFSIIIS